MDRLFRPSPPQTSRFLLLVMLAAGTVFVVLGFVSATDYSPSPLRDTVLVAGGSLLILTGALGLRSPTFSLTGERQLTPARLYGQLGVATLALGIVSILLLGIGWDSIVWLLPGILALHRAWLHHRLARFAEEKGLRQPPDLTL